MFSKAIVYGSKATLLGNEVGSDPSHTHKWSVYVKGANGEDISNVVEKVVIRLHESFAKPERTFTEPPYSVQETGWGEFEIGIKLYFKHQQHPISMIHMLQLYPKDGTTATEVISEHYDEIVFANPNPSLYDILVSTPFDFNEPEPSTTFTNHLETKELEMIQAIHERVLSEYDTRKLACARLEEELRQVLAETKALESAGVTSTV